MNAIESAIEKARLEAEARDAEKEAHIKAEVLKAQQAIRELVNAQEEGLFELLEPYMTWTGRWWEDYRNIYLNGAYKVNAAALQLAPMELGYSNRLNSEIWVRVGGYSYEYAKIHAALAAAREKFPEWQKQQDEQFIRERMPAFNGWNQPNGEVTGKAYEELVERFPEKQREWDRLADEWANCIAMMHQKEAEEQAARARVDQEKAAMLEAWIEHFETVKAIKERNQVKADELNASLDIPFDAWLLTYSVVGQEDGERIVETRDTWVKRPLAAIGNIFMHFDGTEHVYFYPVSITKKTVKPSDRIRELRYQKHYEAYEIHITCPMETKPILDELVEAQGFEPLPDEPKKSESLSYRQNADVRNEAFNSVYCPDEPAQQEDEVPF